MYQHQPWGPPQPPPAGTTGKLLRFLLVGATAEPPPDGLARPSAPDSAASSLRPAGACWGPAVEFAPPAAVALGAAPATRERERRAQQEVRTLFADHLH